MRKLVSGSQSGDTRYAYDEAGQLIGEYAADGSLINEVVYLGNMPVLLLRLSGVFNIQTDQLNSPRAILSSGQIVVWQWDSAPFGETLANEDVDGNGVPLNSNLRFPGQVFDAETGLHYNYFRDYDPVTGRYVESDPIGLKAGVNTYSYVNAGPYTGLDPFGLETVLIFPTEGNPERDPADPWKYAAEHAKKRVQQLCSKDCDNLKVDVISVNNVSQIQAAINSHNDITKIIIIGHASSTGIYVGSSDAPGTNISTEQGENNVNPESIDWSGLTPQATIQVWGCNAGRGENPIAKALAKAANRPVTAPNTYLNFTDEAANRGMPFFKWWRSGGWRTFRGDSK